MTTNQPQESSGTGHSEIPVTPGDTELVELGVASAAKAIAQGDVSAVSYAQALLRHARLNADLRSFITIDEESVLHEAEAADAARAAGATAPLLGVPLGFKDSYQTTTHPTTLGLTALDAYVPATEATAVTAIRSAGGIVFGKNNLVEMSYGVTGHNQGFGQALNPYDQDHVSGGSSSGSAVSVAARIVPASFGGDTVGSIRIPAALTGVVGFKPTTGRWPRKGVAPISHTLDTTGLLARHVEDVELIDGVLTQSSRVVRSLHAGVAGLRFAYAPKHYLQLVDPEIEQLFWETVARLRDGGAEVTEVDLGDDFSDLADRTAWNLFLRDTHRAVAGFLAEHSYPLSFNDIYAGLKPQLHEVWASVVVPDGPAYLSDAAYASTLSEDRPALQNRFDDVFTRSGFDAVIFPTTPAPAPAIADQWEFSVAGQTVPHLFLAKNTVPASGAGIPGISLPAGLNRNGLPMGIELNGAFGDDRRLLGTARRVEEVLRQIPAPSRTDSQE